jgi:hypothetical protein
MEGVVQSPDLWASFIIPAYALTIGGLVVLLAWAYFSMRAAERRAEDQRRK